MSVLAQKKTKNKTARPNALRAQQKANVLHVKPKATRKMIFSHFIIFCFDAIRHFRVVDGSYDQHKRFKQACFPLHRLRDERTCGTLHELFFFFVVQAEEKRMNCILLFYSYLFLFYYEFFCRTKAH